MGCVFLAAWLLLGCKSLLPANDMVIGPVYRPSNVYRASAVMPPTLRRVAVLPLTAASSDAAAEEGRLALDPVLATELNKTRAFETVFLTPEQMIKLTGQARWSAADSLPTNLVKSIQQSVGSDAILFSELSQFRAYPPIAIGWHFKLVECQENQILWSVDEVFDSGDGSVANAARMYYKEHLRQPEPLADSLSIFSSPRRFGQYTLSAAFSTLPAR
jgi:hypothetical protein